MAVTPPPTGPPPAAGVYAGARLGDRYRLDEQIAAGGMAQVWLGTDEVLRRSVAIKVLHQHLANDETFVTRFRHEAIAVARLSHPSIVNVYDTCSDDGVEAIVMELVRGQTLRERLDLGPIDPWEAANVASQVAGALAVAHAAGLVHRDIKPANILLSDDGRVKVSDFGIAKAAESTDLTQEGAFIGTAKYLAPEQVEGKPVDGRTDLYSLGIVLYEMLCGRVPFEGDSSSATALARLHSDPQPPRLVRAGIPPELEAITMRLLARDPGERFPTATDVRAALLGAGADERAHAGPSPLAPNAYAPATGRTGAVPPTSGRTGAVPAATGRTSAVGPATGRTGATASVSTHGHQPVAHSGYDHLPPGSAGRATRFAESERRWLVPGLVVLLLAVAVVVAAILFSQSSPDILDDGDDEPAQPSEPASNEPLTIVRSIDFDPQGDGEEHPHEADAGNVFDGDLSTGWSTSEYRGPAWAGLKEGVGLILELEESSPLSRLELDSPRQQWSAEIYVAERPVDSVDAWGDPVAEIGSDATDGSTVEVDLGGAEGRAVLVWFTDPGPTFQMTVNEVRVFD